MKPKGNTLTDKQARFCEEYPKDLNATQAAFRAGYSERTAAEQGYQLLQKTSVQAEMRRLMKERSERVELDADLVVQRLLWESDELNPKSTPASRVNALGLLGRHLSMFVERHELIGTQEVILIRLEDPAEADRLVAQPDPALPEGQSDKADDDDPGHQLGEIA